MKINIYLDICTLDTLFNIPNQSAVIGAPRPIRFFTSFVSPSSALLRRALPSSTMILGVAPPEIMFGLGT